MKSVIFVLCLVWLCLPSRAIAELSPDDFRTVGGLSQEKLNTSLEERLARIEKALASLRVAPKQEWAPPPRTREDRMSPTLPPGYRPIGSASPVVIQGLPQYAQPTMPYYATPQPDAPYYSQPQGTPLLRSTFETAPTYQGGNCGK